MPNRGSRVVDVVFIIRPRYFAVRIRNQLAMGHVDGANGRLVNLNEKVRDAETPTNCLVSVDLKTGSFRCACKRISMSAA